LEGSSSLLSYATNHTSIEAVCRELCLFWWRLFQNHIVQTGPIWLPSSWWIMYHLIRFYPMYYTWMESVSSLLSYATNGTSIEAAWRELCPFSWRLFWDNRTGPIWARWFGLVRSDHPMKCSNSCIFEMGLFVRPPAQLGGMFLV